MPTTQVLTPPVPAAEPVSLAMLCVHLRLDLSQGLLKAFLNTEGNGNEIDKLSTELGYDEAVVAQLQYLQTLNAAAREKVEAYTGRFFAPQTLQITFRLDDAYILPAGAEATDVEGFIDDLDRLPTLGEWLEEYRKGINISRELPWAEALAQTYTVTAELSAPPVSNLANAAIMELVGEMYRNRETTLAGYATSVELPVSWKVKLAQLVVSPIGAYA